MTTYTLTGKYASHITLPVLGLSFKQRRIAKIMLFILIADALLFLFIIKMVTSPAMMATASAPVAPENPPIIENLKQYGLSPVIVKEVDRPSFSVPVQLVALGNDSIEVLEYSDTGKMKDETGTFIARNSSVKENPWRDLMHMYIKDDTAVFYMGNDVATLEALEKTFGTAAMQFL